MGVIPIGFLFSYLIATTFGVTLTSAEIARTRRQGDEMRRGQGGTALAFSGIGTAFFGGRGGQKDQDERVRPPHFRALVQLRRAD